MTKQDLATIIKRIDATQQRPRWDTLDQFLSDEKFHEEEFKDTSQLPLHFVMEMQGKERFYNPYNRIVGHEKDKELSKRSVEQFVNSIVELESKIAKLKEQGYRKEDIIDMVRKGLTMPIIFRVGPYGSSKTIQQEAEMEYLQMLKKSLKLKGFDYVAFRDARAPQGFRLEQMASPSGRKLRDEYEENQKLNEKLSKYLKWGTIGTILTGTTYGLAELLVQYWWVAQYYGYDWTEWIFLNYAQFVPPLALSVIAGATLSIGRTLYNAFNKDKKDHPALLSEGGEVPHVYIGKNETIEGLIGGVENKNGVAPQDSIRQADMLRAHENIFMVENLGDLSDELQGSLAQILEEKVIEFANLPRGYRQLVYSLMSLNVNTEKLPFIKESLRNRMNYAKIMNVLNEVDRDSVDVVIEGQGGSSTVVSSRYVKRSRFNERHFGLAVLAKTIYGIGGRPWKKEGYEELVNYCSRLADNSRQMRISRRVIGMIKSAEDIRAAEEEKTRIRLPYVELRHILMAEEESKSITRAVMETKLDNYSVQTSGTHDKFLVGRVNVATIYHDPLLKGLGSDVPEEIYDYIEKEDYMGYTIPIQAVAKTLPAGVLGELNIVSKDSSLNRDFYRSSLKILLQMDGIDLDSYKISISIPSLKDDDSILAGAYVAVKSAINNTPVRQDVKLALHMLETGEITSLDKLNMRLLDTVAQGNKFLISGYDMHNKTLDAHGNSLYKGTNIKEVSNKSELMKLISGENGTA